MLITPVRIRNLLAIAAVTAMSATGVASAAAMHRPGAGQTIAPVTQVSVAMGVQGGATGDGPADDAACEKYANAVNSWNDAATDEGVAGNLDQAIHDYGVAQQIENQGLDDGCFFIDPR